ncbi:Detected protein of confused Function [Hibiscus syriacus]|uniref:Detected protein of confused Function n=1 Tax=Hibiscus syriacus TaxID=106335 RepID=A0A6A3AVN8_HIBSY|nr:Detected protein of confused Function [Hibiscus syriacus]
MVEAADALLSVEDRKQLCNDSNYKQRRNSGYDFWKRNKQRKLEKKLLNEDDHAVYLPNPMISFRVLTEPDQITQRTLLEDAIGPFYFYYEKVALAPVGSAKLTEMICKALEAYDDESPSSVQKYVLDECQKWNLVWVGRHKFIPLKLDDVEILLEVAFYCLGIPLKQSSEGHNGYHLDKENDRHRRSSNDVSRLEPASRYNQSAGECHKFNSPDFLPSWTTCLQKCEVLHYSGLVHSFSTTEVDFGKVGSFKLVQYVASGFH